MQGGIAMLKRGAASALGALRRLSNDSSRLFSTAGGAYPVIDHTFDAIVVGAGNLGRKFRVAAQSGAPHSLSVFRVSYWICTCRRRWPARRSGPERGGVQHSVSAAATARCRCLLPSACHPRL